MDETGYSIVAQTAAKAATEIYVHLITAGQLPEGGFSAQVWDMAYSHIGQKIIGSAKRAFAAEQGSPQPVPPPHPVEDPGAPFGPPAQPVPQAPVSVPAPQPVPQSQPVAQPSAVMSGPPCPQCQTPTVQTKDYVAKKARNLSEGKKPPPMWKCPLGTWDPQTKTAGGCSGSIWEDAA